MIVRRGRKEPAFEIKYTAVVPYKGNALRRCLQQLARHAHCFQVRQNTYITLSAIQGRCRTVRTRWSSVQDSSEHANETGNHLRWDKVKVYRPPPSLVRP